MYDVVIIIECVVLTSIAWYVWHCLDIRVLNESHDIKCQEEYEQGVNDCKEDLKEEVASSIRKSFRAGIEKGKQDLKIEDELYSKKIYRKIVVKK